MQDEARENRLLATLPETELRQLLRFASVTHVPREHVIRRQGDHPASFHLPLAGLVSVVGRDADGAGVDVAVVGVDGLVDAHAALIDVPLPTEVVQQIAGAAIVVGASDFREAVARLPGLRRTVDVYLAALFVEVAQGSACNRLHDLQERLARWLLMTAAHVGTDQFALTHELLALMAGSSRPKVSERLGVMAEAGMIALGRNDIRLVDREALVSWACDCYGTIMESRAAIYRTIEP